MVGDQLREGGAIQSRMGCPGGLNLAPSPVWPWRIWQADVCSSKTFRQGLLEATTMWESSGPRNRTSNTSSL